MSKLRVRTLNQVCEQKFLRIVLCHSIVLHNTNIHTNNTQEAIHGCILLTNLS